MKDFLKAAHDYDLPEPSYAVCGVGTEIYTFGHPDADKANSHLHNLDKTRWLNYYAQQYPDLMADLFNGE